MKKIIKDYTSKPATELIKMIQMLREEIARAQLNEKTNPAKDTNLVFRKKKQLAVALTVLNQKKEAENLQGADT